MERLAAALLCRCAPAPQGGLVAFPDEALRLPKLRLLNLSTNRISSLPDAVACMTRCASRANCLACVPAGVACACMCCKRAIPPAFM